MLYIPFPFKRCSTCGAYLPPTTKFFNKNRYNRDGLQFRCIQCRKNHYQIHREETIQHVADYRQKNRDRILASKRVFWRKHSARLNSEKRAKYAQIPARWAEYRIRNYQKHHSAYRQQAHNHYRQHREEIIAETKRYHETHPEVARVAGQRYRAKKRNLPNTLTTADWQHALDYFVGCCAVCGRPPGFWHKLIMDHWIPISDPRPDNPGTVPANIVPLCHGYDGCNNSKSNRDPIEWLNEYFGKQETKRILNRIEAYFEHVKRRP